MGKKILATLSLVIAMLSSFITASTLQSLEITYPVGTRTFISVNFSSLSADKNEVISAIEDLTYDKGSFGVLSKVESISHDKVKLFYFGDHNSATDELKGNNYSGRSEIKLIPLSDLSEASLSGTYSFTDSKAMQSAVKIIEQYGGSVVNSGSRVSNIDVLGLLANNRSGGFGIALLFVVVCATCWSWIGNRERLHSILVLNGCQNKNIVYRDTSDFLRVWMIPYVIGIVISIALSLVLYSVNSVFDYLEAYLASVILFLILFLVVVAVFSIITMPSVRNISLRRNLSKRLLFGQVFLKLVCIVLALVSGAMALSSFESASQQFRSVKRWEGVQQVVSVKTFADPTTSSSEVAQAFNDFFSLADARGGLYLSYSVAPALVEGANPTANDISKQLSPYDDVIITNRSFLNLMNVSENDLKKIDSSHIPASVLSGLRGYDGIWLNEHSGIAMEDCLYEWKGEGLFPALEYGAQNGMFSMTRNPLVIVVDAVSKDLNINGFVYPALSTSNIIFNDADFVNSIAEESGLLSSINSINRVSDDAFYQYRILKQLGETNLFYLIIVLLEVVLSTVEGAYLWAYENRRRIFIRHTLGEHYLRLSSGHCVTQAVLLLISCIIAYVVVGQQKLLSNNICIFMTGISVLCLSIEIISVLLASNKCFTEVVNRAVK